jgi:hypothetical protein
MLEFREKDKTIYYNNFLHLKILGKYIEYVKRQKSVV